MRTYVQAGLVPVPKTFNQIPGHVGSIADRDNHIESRVNLEVPAVHELPAPIRMIPLYAK